MRNLVLFIRRLFGQTLWHCWRCGNFVSSKEQGNQPCKKHRVWEIETKKAGWGFKIWTPRRKILDVFAFRKNPRGRTIWIGWRLRKFKFRWLPRPFLIVHYWGPRR